MTRHRWLLRGFRGARAAADPARRSRTRSCGARSRRRDEVGCKRMMLTDDWYPTLTRSRTSSSSTTGSRRSRPDGVRPPTARERPADVLVLATGFKTHAFVAPMEITGPGGARWPTSGATSRAPTSASPSRASRTCSCSTGRTPTAAPARSSPRSRRRWRHVLAALARVRAAGARTIEVRREARRRRSIAAARRRWPGPSGTPAARTGTSTRTATTRSQWPWSWSAYRRRTARLDVADYELFGERQRQH